MGSSLSSESALVLCSSGRCSHSFPLRLSADAARACSAAAMGGALSCQVEGYTTKLTKEAGVASLRLQLLSPRPRTLLLPSCAALALRAANQMGFLAGIGALVAAEEEGGTLLEAVVFGRPNEAFLELMPLEESTLQELYPLGSTADLRLLRSMRFEHYGDHAERLPDGSADGSSAGGDEAASEALPQRSVKAEWLVERLLSLASTVEVQFSAPHVGGEASYEEHLNAEQVQTWLASAGLRAELRGYRLRVGTVAAGAPEEAKRELLLRCAGGNRGFVAREVTLLLETLAEHFQAPPGARERLDALRGRWKLIYTSSSDLTSLENLPLGWRTGRVGQSFLTSRFARNEIDFFSPLQTQVTQLVNCTYKLPEPLEEKFFVELAFRYSSTQLNLPFSPNLTLPLPPGAGIFQVAYLDDELLVQKTRLGQSSVNVLLKETD
ncbi:Thimet oligopeptidase [Durusdinium trenchii]|uniref:Thimet oligopeptidase n=1 Tax=Durusdinium trenchii TaxID=1381693 RepID=A0ABP0LF66_9DINO